MDTSTLSIVIPVFNEEENISALVERLDKLIDQIGGTVQVEVLLVDDHSGDKSPTLLKTACQQYKKYHYLRLAKNSGAHIAILAGLAQARGDCAVFLAADLQDPPELIPKMLNLWQQGNQVVWAVRERREGISMSEQLLSWTTWSLLNRFGEAQIPPHGTDFALIDRTIIQALKCSVTVNPNIVLEIARLGFQQTEIQYTKAERQFGQSKWNLERKLKIFIDSFVSTSYMPLRIMSYLGIIASAFGFFYAIVVFVLRLTTPNHPIEGWSALMVVILVFGGIQMIMLGIIGEYLWRTLEQTRKRPLYFIEDREPSVPNGENRSNTGG